jgi:predicted ribosome quality control (RQC) complex YloA/Tae2 family protein
VGVGISAIGNDQLRNKWSGKDDYWVHLDGLKSAHAIVKITSGTLTQDMLNLGASIVAKFSHFSDDWIPVIYTQVKNVKGVSGAAGMVIYKKEKHLRCHRIKIEDLIEE